MSDKENYGISGDATEFHQRRRMFVVREEALELAPVNDVRSHKGWFKDSDWQWVRLMAESPRGYVDEKGIHFYAGFGFRYDEGLLRDLQPHLPELVERTKVDRSLGLYGGKKIKETVGEFLPRIDLGKILDYL